MKAGNTLDTLITENGRGIVRHYLQDVGSNSARALCSEGRDEGHEYLFESSPVWKRLVTLGFFVSPWQTIDYEERREVGKFEGRMFEPERWRPRVPVAALRHARLDDTFWAALRVMAFTDEQIRSAVRTGEFTDPSAERLLGDVLIERRNKIGQVYFSRVNPLIRFALTDAGVLTFDTDRCGRNSRVRLNRGTRRPGIASTMPRIRPSSSGRQRRRSRNASRVRPRCRPAPTRLSGSRSVHVSPRIRRGRVPST